MIIPKSLTKERLLFLYPELTEEELSFYFSLSESERLAIHINHTANHIATYSEELEKENHYLIL